MAELINEYNKVHEEQRQEKVNKDILQKDVARENLRKLKLGQYQSKRKWALKNSQFLVYDQI